jgi:excinuclease ABC subunit C
LRSELQEIPGVGAATARKLLRKFGSVARVQKASSEELAQVISRAQAARVLAHFRG